MRLFRDDPVRDGLIAATAVAVLLAVWFGVSWAMATQDDQLTAGRERDAVLAAADTGLAALHTLDYRNAGRDIDRWAAVTVGRLRHDLAGDRDAEVKRARAGKTLAAASIVRSALTELDATGGTARVIAVLDLKLVTQGKPHPQQRRVNAELRRNGDGTWLIASVEAAT